MSKEYYTEISTELSKRKRCLLRRALRKEIAYLSGIKLNRVSPYGIRRRDTVRTNLRDLNTMLDELNVRKLTK